MRSKNTCSLLALSTRTTISSIDSELDSPLPEQISILLFTHKDKMIFIIISFTRLERKGGNRKSWRTFLVGNLRQRPPQAQARLRPFPYRDWKVQTDLPGITSERQRYRTARSTKTNIAFGYRKTGDLGLQKARPRFNNCRIKM